MNKPKYIKTAFIAFALDLIVAFIQTYIMKYYVDIIALSFILSGSLRLIHIVVDALAGLFIAAYQDKNKKHHGSRIRYIKFASIILPLALVSVFLLDRGQIELFPFIAFPFLFFSIVSYQILLSVIYVNYSSLFPLEFKNIKERTIAQNYRTFLSLIGIIIGMALSPILLDKIGYLLTTIIYAFLFAVCALIYCYKYEEKLERTIVNIKIKDTLKLIKDKRLMLLVTISGLLFAINGTLITFFPIYNSAVLKFSPVFESLFIASVLACAALSTFIIRFLLRFVSYYRLWIISALFFAFGMILLLQFQDYYIFTSSFFIGFGFAGGTMFSSIFNADLIDRDYKQHNIDRSMSINSISSLVRRAFLAFPILAYLVLSLIYRFQNSDNPGSNPHDFFLYLMSIVPALLSLISIIFILILKKINDDSRRDSPIINDIGGDYEILNEH